jgi:hypothetical protein
MSQSERAATAADQATDSPIENVDVESLRERSGPLAGYLRTAADSGALAGASGAVTVLRGLSALRKGKVGRGLGRLALGGLFIAVARYQRRSGSGGNADVDERDVVGSPDVGGIETDDGDRTPEHTGASVVDNPDVEDVSDGVTEDAPEHTGTSVSGSTSDLEDVSEGTGESRSPEHEGTDVVGSPDMEAAAEGSEEHDFDDQEKAETGYEGGEGDEMVNDPSEVEDDDVAPTDDVADEETGEGSDDDDGAEAVDAAGSADDESEDEE